MPAGNRRVFCANSMGISVYFHACKLFVYVVETVQCSRDHDSSLFRFIPGTWKTRTEVSKCADYCFAAENEYAKYCCGCACILFCPKADSEVSRRQSHAKQMLASADTNAHTYSNRTTQKNFERTSCCSPSISCEAIRRYRTPVDIVEVLVSQVGRTSAERRVCLQ